MPPTGSKQNTICCLLHVDFLLGLFFDTEDEGDMFLRNVGLLSVDYTALYPRLYKFRVYTSLFCRSFFVVETL
jgi:hypothetical protein